MPHLSSLRFLFVVGKGGVGKTSVSAALALALAANGKRVLVAMCNANERLSHLLGTDAVGEDIRTLEPGVDAVNMRPDAALREYGAMVLKAPAVYKAVFENRFVSSFLKGIPGLEAWSMLGKAFYHTTEKTNGRHRYDVVIVDAPATGHALDMLRVPQVLTDVAPPGLLRQEADAAMALFRDSSQAGAVVVTLLEDMPVNETLELHHALDSELNIPVQALITNCVLPRLFSPRDQTLINALVAPPSLEALPTALRPLVDAGYRRSARETIQCQALEKLRDGLPLEPFALPYWHGFPFERDAIETLAAVFKDALR